MGRGTRPAKQSRTNIAWRLAIALPLGLAATGLAAQERISRWEATVTGTGAVAADCQNCGEDIAVWMECENGVDQFHVSFRGVPTDQGRNGDLVSVLVTVDGNTESRVGRLSFFGPPGYAPVVDIGASETLMDRMASGRVLTVRSTGSERVVPLDGSFIAIATLRQTCG